MIKLCSVIFGLALMSCFPAFSFEKSKSFEMTPNSGIAPIEVSLNAEALHQHANIFIWNFGNGETLTTTNPKINYTFKNAGTFTVQLKYLKNKQDKLDKGKDGGSATIVVVPNKLPTPQLSCVSNVVHQTECNAEGSTDSDGTILSYKYDWGDGSDFSTTSQLKVGHTFENGGIKTIGLTVTDKLGFTNNISKSIYIFDSEVPDSGPLGLSTAKGIDSDNDNVRDDVQRWIAFEAKDNVRLKSVLKRLAQNYQLNILNHTNIEYSQNLIIQKMSIEACLDGIVPDDVTYEHLTSMMNYIHFYSEQRIYIRSEILKNMAGLDFPPISMTDEGQLQQCELLGL